jgi:hypothetical protein
MTWIVGTPYGFGYGIGISDVRVTVGAAYYDCLQKIYPVGQFIAMGFAGSVRIGFAMVDAASSFLHNDNKLLACDPIEVSKRWPSLARKVFEGYPESEKREHCDLMMISVHPTKNCGESPWARPYVHIFKSPEFEPISIAVNKVGAIGCGEGADACRRVVEELSNDYKRMSFIRQGEQGTPGGMASMLGIQLTGILKDAQPEGISAHLQYCWVYRGRITIKTNDHSVSGRWSVFETGSGITGQPSPDLSGATFAMPKLATSWSELHEMLRAAGVTADCYLALC